MKRLIALVLVVVLALSFSITAFAKQGAVRPADNAGSNLLLGVYNTSDVKIDVIPTKDILILTPEFADQLSPYQQMELWNVCAELETENDGRTRSVFWLQIYGNYFNEKDFAYVRYPFRAYGADPKLTVNGKEMEVVNLTGTSYYAKLTECGAVCISWK